MQIKNISELKVEKYEKCKLVCESDCTLGELYDFSFHLQSYILERMKAVNEANKSNESKIEELKAE